MEGFGTWLRFCIVFAWFISYNCPSKTLIYFSSSLFYSFTSEFPLFFKGSPSLPDAATTKFCRKLSDPSTLSEISLAFADKPLLCSLLTKAYILLVWLLSSSFNVKASSGEIFADSVLLLCSENSFALGWYYSLAGWLWGAYILVFYLEPSVLIPFTSNSVVLSAFFSLPSDDYRRESAPISFMDKVSCRWGVLSRGLFCNW